MCNSSNRLLGVAISLLAGCGTGMNDSAPDSRPQDGASPDAPAQCSCPAAVPGRVTYCGRFVSVGKQSGPPPDLGPEDVDVFQGSYFLTDPETAPHAAPESVYVDACGTLVIEDLVLDPLGLHALVAVDERAGIERTATILSHLDQTAELRFFATESDDLTQLETMSGLTLASTGMGIALVRDCTGHAQPGATVVGDGDVWYFSDLTEDSVRMIDPSATSTGSNGAALLGPQSLQPTVSAAPASCERASVPRAHPSYVTVREMWPLAPGTLRVPCPECSQ